MTRVNEAIADFDSAASLLFTVRPSINLFVVTLPESRSVLEAVDHFQGVGDVEYALPSIIIYARADNPRPPGSPDDPNFAGQDYLTQINAPTAWDRQIGSMDIIVAVLDSGIQLDNPDLAQNLYLNVGEIPPGIVIVDAEPDGQITFRDLNAPVNAGIVTDANGNGFIDGFDVLQPTADGGLADGIDNDEIPGDDLNVVDDLCGARIGEFPRGVVVQDNRVSDDHSPSPRFPFSGHGTMVAGLLGAQGNNATSGGMLAGLNWNVRILPIKACASDGSCNTEILLAQGLRYARRMGASVMNFSLGNTQRDSTATTAKVNRIVLDPAMRLYNDGLEGAPESALWVIAADNAGLDCSETTVVCFPAEMPVPTRIVVGAVDGSDGLAGFSNRGTSIVGIAAPGVDMLVLDRFGSLETVQGTSFAAPLVSGAAALLLAQFDTTLPGDLPALRSRIFDTAAVIPTLDSIGGMRRLDVGAAISMPDP